jgi:regulatory protein
MASNEILNIARKFCAYQERSQQELRDKLYTLGLFKSHVEETIAIMVTEGFINEERFAIAYAGGKFRVKQWGKIKIKLALQQKRVSAYCIKKALEAIDDTLYKEELRLLVEKQIEKSTEKNIMKRNYKIGGYFISRGFEPEMVWDILRQTIS